MLIDTVANDPDGSDCYNFWPDRSHQKIEERKSPKRWSGSGQDTWIVDLTVVGAERLYIVTEAYYIVP